MMDYKPWLKETWQHYNKAGTFDVDLAQWIAAYPNIFQDMQAPDGSFEAMWDPTCMTTLPDQKTPALVRIALTPETLKDFRAEPREKQKPGPKTNATQITVDGKETDLRNRANFDLLNGRIEDVENVAESYLHQFRIEGVTKGQRRRLICELHRVMLLRGKELSRPLYGSICLRLGMPLPPDFWHLPAGMLPKTVEASAREVEVECR